MTAERTQADPPDVSQRATQSYMIGVFLATNAIRDAYLLVEGPDCVHMKIQYVQGNHDLLSTLTSVSGFHRVANTALHPVEMAGSREKHVKDALTGIARRPSIEGVFFTSMPMAFITGSDYDRLCRDVEDDTGKTLIHIEGKSLSGDWLDGYEQSLKSLARQLDLSGGKPTENRVAIVGNLFDRNEGDHRGNVKELRRILAALGLETTSIWLDGTDFANLGAVRDAATILSFPYGRAAARFVSRRTGARLVECDLPFGLTATESWVRQLGTLYDREKEAEQLIDRELREIVPALEWVIPLYCQSRRWGYVGDPHLAPGLNGIARVVGARLSFASITNHHHHGKALKEKLGTGTKIQIHPRQKALAQFTSQVAAEDNVELVVSTSDGLIQADVASVELGFPSVYAHCLYERPFLGFRGFLAFMDSLLNAMRRHEVEQTRRPYRERLKQSQSDGDAQMPPIPFKGRHNP